MTENLSDHRPKDYEYKSLETLKIDSNNILAVHQDILDSNNVINESRDAKEQQSSLNVNIDKLSSQLAEWKRKFNAASVREANLHAEISQLRRKLKNDAEQEAKYESVLRDNDTLVQKVSKLQEEANYRARSPHVKEPLSRNLEREIQTLQKHCVIIQEESRLHKVSLDVALVAKLESNCLNIELQQDLNDSKDYYRSKLRYIYEKVLELRSSYKQTRESILNSLNNQISIQIGTIRELQDRADRASCCLRSTEEALMSSRYDLNLSQHILMEASVLRSSLLDSLYSADIALDDIRLNSSLSSKSQQSLIKELKNELKKVTLRCKQFEVTLHSIRDENKGLPIRACTSSHSSLNITQNVELRQRVAYLQETVQRMQSVISNKSLIVKHLISRSDICTSPSKQSPTAFESSVIRDDYYLKLEVLLQDLVLENERLHLNISTNSQFDLSGQPSGLP